MRRLAALLALPALTAAPAHAVTWSKPTAYDPATCRDKLVCVSEPAPRVAVNARGTAVATWIDTKRRVRVAMATKPGRFGAATTLDTRGLRPFGAVAPDGTITVVWQDRHGTLRFARRAPGRRRFGPSARLAPRGDKDGDDGGRIAAQPDGSSAVVYESGDFIRAVTVSAAGKPGTPVSLGKGRFGHDSVRVAPDGTLAACCIEPVNTDPSVPPDTAEKTAVFRAGGWHLVPAAHDEDVEIETVFGSASGLAVGLVTIESSGDAGIQGVPLLARAGADDVVGPPLRATVDRPTRGLAPDVTIDGSGRSVLVFQEKRGPQAFRREAPVYASVAAGDATALGARRRLTDAQAYQPTVRPFGTGAIAVWQAPHARWGVAIERDGRFRHAPAPRRPGPDVHLGEDFNYAYDLATNRNHAVLTWIAADGSIRVSELG